MQKIKIFLEKNRLKFYNRYKTITTYIFNFPIKIKDKSSFLFMYEEIFEKEIYKFKTNNNNPIIIDCGSNIGLSVLYFKKIYPNSKIISFEPEKDIFNILKNNIKKSKYTNIELHNKGLSDKKQEINFFAEGSDGGRIATENDFDNIQKIKTVKLSDFIKNTKIDFLKIDIEGEEVKVIKECREYIGNAENIFIEYHSIKNKEQELDIILKILKENGFEYYIESVGIKSDKPFIKKETYLNYNNQLNISAKKI